MEKQVNKKESSVLDKDNKTEKQIKKPENPVEEIGGFDGPEPTRYGDWEKKGRCVDF